MQNLDHVHLLDRTPGSEISIAPNEACAVSADRVLGRVIAVSGSQATADLTAASEDAAAALPTIGALVGISTAGAFAVGTLCEIAADAVAGEQHGRIVVRIDLLGEIAARPSGEPRFQNGIRTYPTIGSTVVPIGGDELRIIFGLENPDTVAIGELQQDASIAATIDAAEMVCKHFAIVGSTGSGKSTALALLLRKLTQSHGDLRVLLIDAHNEYADCFEDRAQVFGPGNLKLPFWLLNFDEIVQIIFGSRSRAEHEIALLAELIPAAKTEYARAKSVLRASYRPAQSEANRHTLDTPVPYRFEDVIAAAESRMGKLENGDLAVQYQRLLMRINAVRSNPRYAFIFEDAAETSDRMVEILCQLLRLKDAARPMAIVQLAGFPAETVDVIVSVLFRLAFDFGIWSDALSPLLIVCEEAHNYANADPAVGFRPAREGLSRIAKEGRKHGVFLGLVTQRPHQLDPTLISQCSTVFAMRLGHDDDQRIVRAAVSDAASRLLAFLPSLGTREALVIGAAVPTVTRVRFEELPAQWLPCSQAVWGSNMGGNQVTDSVIADVVARWRGSAPVSKPAPAPMPDPTSRANDLVGWSATSYRS
jgi:DNA helicase HerA-like ATPase